jgi:ApaG protein
VHITNNGKQSVQLIARRWLIVDDNDEVQEVAGEGVIGQKPHIAPGQSFHYTSGAMLQTPFGTMRGDYEMITQSGEHFLADIPPFLLSLPDSVH